MKITVNGEQVTVEPPCTVAELIARLKLTGVPAAVEVNRRLVPKPRHAEHTLDNGDTIEIVTLVGGG